VAPLWAEWWCLPEAYLAQLKKGTTIKKQLWGLVFGMPRLLQQDKDLKLPPDATLEDHGSLGVTTFVGAQWWVSGRRLAASSPMLWQSSCPE
jgi:hypothetical protein